MFMNFHEGKDNPDIGQSKGSDRIQINSILVGVSVAILALATGDLGPFGGIAVYALVVAVPLLVTSSLAYTKLCYRKGEYVAWNALGWWTQTLGYFLVIDATAILLASKGNTRLAGMLLISNWLLVMIYSVVDIGAAKDASLAKRRAVEKLLKGVVVTVVLSAAWITIRYYTTHPAAEKPEVSIIQSKGQVLVAATSVFTPHSVL